MIAYVQLRLLMFILRILMIEYVDFFWI